VSYFKALLQHLYGGTSKSNETPEDSRLPAEKRTWNLGSRGNLIGIVTGYRLDGRGSIPGREKRVFSTASRHALGPTQPPIQWVDGYGGGALSGGHEADHPPSGVEIKSGGAVPLLTHTLSWCCA
jgi:hypothetical protein